MNNVPITGASNFVYFLLLLVAWAFIRGRMQRKGNISLTGIRYLQSYFFFFAIFNLFMATPHALIRWPAIDFSAAMAWSYVIANIFLIYSLGSLSRMAASIVPKWAERDRFVLYFWLAVNALVAIVHIFFVGLRYQPTYDYITHITKYQFPPAVSSLLGIVSLMAYVPAIVLFITSAVKNTGEKRLRSILFAAGMILIMISGPLHAAAPNWQVFMLADVVNIISLILLTTAVVYQLKEVPNVIKAPTTAVPQTT